MNYSFYMTQDNGCTYVIVENRDTETWEAAILGVDVSGREAINISRDFLNGKAEPYTGEDGVTWAEDKEHLLSQCAKYFGFTEIDVEV